MNNPLVGNSPQQMSPMQMLQQLQRNPMQFIKQAGFTIPENLNNPNDIIQHLMNTGQISQQRYDQAVKMAQRFRM